MEQLKTEIEMPTDVEISEDQIKQARTFSLEQFRKLLTAKRDFQILLDRKKKKDKLKRRKSKKLDKKFKH